MHARCTRCGNTVLSYRRYFFYVGRAPVKCAHCGTQVRLRHFRALVYGSLAVGGILMLAVVLLAQSVREFEIAGMAIVLLGVAADYWSWRTLPWDPAQPSEAPTQPPPAT